MRLLQPGVTDLSVRGYSYLLNNILGTNIQVPLYEHLTTFDDALKNTVIMFQERYKLKPDGIIGPKTKMIILDVLMHEQDRYSDEMMSCLVQFFHYMIKDVNGFETYLNELNILGIRQIFFKNFNENRYDDKMILFGKLGDVDLCRVFPCTTDPGELKSGAVVIESNQQIMYRKGLHRGREKALRPNETEKFYYYNHKMERKYGWVPTNIHSSTKYNWFNRLVYNWSHGCQTLPKYNNEWFTFRDLCYASKQNLFTYTLLKLDNF